MIFYKEIMENSFRGVIAEFVLSGDPQNFFLPNKCIIEMRNSSKNILIRISFLNKPSQINLAWFGEKRYL